MSELVVQDQSTSMMALIQRAASDPTIDMDKMERLIALKDRMDAKQAEADFNAALSRVQANMGRVAADRENKQTKSFYATYSALDKAIRSIYTGEGFSLSFSTEDSPEGTVGMVCYVSHAAGHTRTYKAVVPSDGKGAKGGDVMTKTHAFGSGTSYGMRYLLKMIFNIAIGEDDDDGNAFGENEIPAKDQAWIDAVTALTDYPEYLDMKKKMLADYGGKPDNIPNAVRDTFNRIAAMTKPKD